MQVEWIELKELLGKKDMPKTIQGITFKAKSEKWKRRRVEGVKGKVYEYYIGDMPEHLQKELGFEKSKIEIKEQINNVSTDDFAKIPFYKTFASAGFGAVNGDIYKPDDYIGFSHAWLSNIGLLKKNLAVIIASGDSMQPTINNSDLILINRIDTNPKDGNIYVIRQGEQLWVKRVQGIVGGVRLISDNKEIYAPVDITFHENLDFEIIGRVVYVFHSFV